MKPTVTERSHKNADARSESISHASGVVPPSSAPLRDGDELDQLRMRRDQLKWLIDARDRDSTFMFGTTIYGALFILQSAATSARALIEAEIERREGEPCPHCYRGEVIVDDADKHYLSPCPTCNGTGKAVA